MNIRSKKYLDSAKDMPCIACGISDGTVVAAHYQGMRSPRLGKGRGIKPHDIAVAHLCRTCHEKYDTVGAGTLHNGHNLYIKRIDHSEQFLFDILMTIIRQIERGELRFK